MISTHKNKNQRGFSLIELTIVLTIAGLLIAGAASLFHSYLMAERENEQESKISNVQTAFIEFFSSDEDENNIIEQRYPCPADPSIAPGQTGYGVEQRNASNTGCEVVGEIKQVAGAGGDVYIGAVPFATLGMSSENTLDVFGNQLTYAVSEQLTVEQALTNKPVPEGDVLVTQEDRDPAAAPGSEKTTRQPFVVVSHGLNGAGSFTAQGTPHAESCPTGTSTRDAENCDRDDATFKAFARSEGNNTEFFDDEIVFSLIGASADSGDQDQLWAVSPTDTNSIFNRNTNNVGIGTNEPTKKLEVVGEIKIGTDDPTLPSACTSPEGGSMRFNGTDKTIEYCDGSDWSSFGALLVDYSDCVKSNGLPHRYSQTNATEGSMKDQFGSHNGRDAYSFCPDQYVMVGLQSYAGPASSTVSRVLRAFCCKLGNSDSFTGSITGAGDPEGEEGGGSTTTAPSIPDVSCPEGSAIIGFADGSPVCSDSVVEGVRCDPATVTWSSPCRGSLPSGADGETRSTFYDENNGNSCDTGFAGSATYVCDSGTWTLQPGSTCSQAIGCPN